MFSHAQHLIIPLETFSKSLKSFIDNNTLAENNRNYKKKQAFITKEIDKIQEGWDGCADLLENIDIYCNKARLRLDGEVYELGFDMYKFVYNITNIITEECYKIPELLDKNIIKDLDSSYAIKNNIEKFNMLCHPNHIPIITTEGLIFADKYEKV